MVWEPGEALSAAQNRVKQVQVGEESPLSMYFKKTAAVHFPEDGEESPVGE